MPSEEEQVRKAKVAADNAWKKDVVKDVQNPVRRARGEKISCPKAELTWLYVGV